MRATQQPEPVPVAVAVAVECSRQAGEVVPPGAATVVEAPRLPAQVEDVVAPGVQLMAAEVWQVLEAGRARAARLRLRGMPAREAARA